MPWLGASPWKPAIKEKLVELWPHGWSCAVMADKLNIEFRTMFSRNAVIGMVNRMGLEPRKRTLAYRTTKPKQRRRYRPKQLMQRYSQPLPDKEPVLDFRPLNTPFMELRENQCREVMDGKGEDGLAIYCGHPKLESCSYCATHAKINFHYPQVISEAERERRRNLGLMQTARNRGFQA